MTDHDVFSTVLGSGIATTLMFLVVIVAVLAFVCSDRFATFKWIVVSVFVILFSFVIVLGPMSHARPVDIEDLPENFRIEFVRMIEDVGIFLLVSGDGETIPHYYVIEWDSRTAERIARAAQEAAQRGVRGIRGRIVMERNRGSEDGSRILEVFPDDPPADDPYKN